MQGFLFVIFVILALIGLTEIIHKFLSYLVTPKDYTDYLTVFLYGDSAFDYLQAALNKFILGGCYTTKKIIAVDCGISSECLYSVLDIIRKNNSIVFCTLDSLNSVIQKLKEN